MPPYSAAMNLLKNSHLPLVSVIEEYLQCRSLMDGTPLLPIMGNYAAANHALIHKHIA